MAPRLDLVTQAATETLLDAHWKPCAIRKALPAHPHDTNVRRMHNNLNAWGQRYPPSADRSKPGVRPKIT